MSASNLLDIDGTIEAACIAAGTSKLADDDRKKVEAAIAAYARDVFGVLLPAIEKVVQAAGVPADVITSGSV